VIDEALFTGDVTMLRIAMVPRLPTGKAVGHLPSFHNQIDAHKARILGKILLSQFILVLIPLGRENRNVMFLGKLLDMDVKLCRKGIKPRLG
jgi:hypothetical protein